MTATPIQEAPPIVAHVLERLEAVVARPTGRGWRAKCPVEHIAEHENEQLQVTLARDGRVLLECPAGCTTSDVLDSIGLKAADLFPASDVSDQQSERQREEQPLPQAIRAIDAPPPKPVQWIVNDLFTAGEIGLLVGDGGSFKSTAAIHMAGALAGGYAVWNRHEAPARPALIISAEDSLDIVLMRLQSFIAGHGWDRQKVLSNVHVFATTDVSLAEGAWQQHIVNEAMRIQPGMIILDPFAELITGDENSNSEIRPIVKFLRALGRQTNAAVVVVHHAGKQGQDRRALDRIRGASALPSAARSILFFDFQPNGAGVSVEHLKMSRSPRLERFILARHVESDSLNRALWFKATLSHLDVRAAQESRAEAWVMAQVTVAPRTLTTSELKKRGGQERLRGEDIGSALNSLIQQGRIAFEEGARGARKWYPVGTASEELDLALGTQR